MARLANLMLPSATVEPDPLYFFVSRAHADRDRKRSDPDFFVRRVFDDLCRAVRDRRKRPWDAGYLDPCVPTDSADTTSLQALSAARVLVALYSEHYLRDERSQSILERFRARFTERPEDPVDAHVLPVMWEPTAEPSRIAEFRQAIELVPDLRDYAELGLAGIHRLKAYRGAYERLLALFSRWIVDVAEGTPAPMAHWAGGGEAGPDRHRPAGVHAEPGGDQAPGEARPTSRFVIAVLALSTVDLPDGRDADRYGRQPIQWRPYGITQPMPVASHASVRAPIQHTVDLVDHEVTSDTFAESAGLLLVDPWVLAQPQGRQRLMRTLKVLPSWAPPVVLADQNDPQYHPHGVHHVEDAIRLCNATCPGANERRDIPDAEAFDVLIPYWVNLSYRRFRDRPTRRARKSYGRRPRLGDPFRDGEGSATDD